MDSRSTPDEDKQRQAIGALGKVSLDLIRSSNAAFDPEKTLDLIRHIPADKAARIAVVDNRRGQSGQESFTQHRFDGGYFEHVPGLVRVFTGQAGSKQKTQGPDLYFEYEMEAKRTPKRITTVARRKKRRLVGSNYKPVWTGY